MKACFVCGKEFTADEWDERHESHEPDCTHFGKIYDVEVLDDIICDCDCPCHSWCCPECNLEQQARQKEMHL